MAIAVLGMHRSGTSMITRMLAAAGMEVGPADELMPATAENPTGYWERGSMVAINDLVLDRLGMAWDHVPAAPPAGWQQRGELDEIRAHARQVVASYPAGRTWGWKDPRTSLTLPFWDTVLDELPAAVLCVRNPLDVAASLSRRGDMSARLGFQLWYAYSSSALREVAGRAHVVAHYDAFFEDGATELARVCSAIGLEPHDDRLREAASGAEQRHRHGVTGLAQLVASPAPDHVVALYMELLTRCGPTMERVSGRDPMVVADDGSPMDHGETIAWVREFRVERLGAAQAARIV